jgi:hypothetical protein
MVETDRHVSGREEEAKKNDSGKLCMEEPKVETVEIRMKNPRKVGKE